ncbi:MAG: hypothetical protein HUU14_03305 [Dehalococcoidia bacterium]|nr:hypothetical protein [Dehalococcoidia bacterium]
MVEQSREHILAPPAPERIPEIPPFVRIDRPRAAAISAGARHRHSHDAPGRGNRRLWVVGALILAAGLAGFVYLSLHFRADTDATARVALPGTDLVVDKPAGWSAHDLSEAPELVGLFLDDSGSASQGLVFGRHGASIFVVHVPNVTGMQAIPEFPATVGDLTVEAQDEMSHALGAGRTLVVTGEADGARIVSETTLLLVEDRILVVGVLAPHDLTTGDLAAAHDVTASLRPA